DGMTPEDLFGVAAAEAHAHVSGDLEISAIDSRLATQNDEDDPTIDPSTTPVTPVAALPVVPVVRFAKSATVPPPVASSGLAEPTRPTPSTKQGIAPVKAATAVRAPSPSKPPSTIRIGDTIAARARPKRTWLYVLGALLLFGGAATAVTLVLTRENRATSTSQADKATAKLPRETGTVRFVTEPADAEIKIAGELVHTGSPWANELAAGNHQIEIHRTGYKSWLTSIDLSANETQTLRVVLEPLTTTAAGEASLTITTTPAGLEVLIDGHPQPQRTPFKGKLEVGPHKISVRQNGVEVWQQNLAAEASSDYEFNPLLTADKLRDRAQRAPSRAPSPSPSSAPSGTTPSTAEPFTKPEVKADHQDPAPTWTKPGSNAPTATPAVVAPTTNPPVTPITPAPPPTTTATTTAAPSPSPAQPPTKPSPPPAPAPKQNVAAPVTPVPSPASPPATKKPTAPAIVAPNAVKKISGDPPSIEKFRNVELPASLAAKVCIDETGKVTSADMLSKVPTRVANDLTTSLRSWRYAPHKQAGTVIPACFVVTFRSK
ncbi:MAG TPA: PEGA domain-containing protein, partial [Kofleriaceae bacterium]